MSKDSKMSLQKIQQWMQGTILDPHNTDSEEIVNMIKPSKRLTAHQHLAIYQRSYVARLRDCMSQQFGVLEYALGPDLFQRFSDQYLQTYPSESYTLHDLGEKFPLFLEETRPDRDSEVKEDWPDFLIELATFEYHIQLIFDQEDLISYSSATIDSPDDSLKLVPLFHLFEFRFPVNYYFQSFKRGENPELPFEQPSWCIIYRNDFQVAIHGVSYWQYQFLKYFNQEGDIKATLEKIALESGKTFAEVHPFWEEWKALWINKGLLCVINDEC